MVIVKVCSTAVSLCMNCVVILSVIMAPKPSKRINPRIKIKIYAHLIGLTIERLNVSCLPTYHQVLSRFLHCLKLEKESSKKIGYKLSIEVLNCWKNADIPTILLNSIERKIIALYKRWSYFNTNRRIKSGVKLSNFLIGLNSLFDVSNKSKCKSLQPEEQEFLNDQRSGRMLLNSNTNITNGVVFKSIKGGISFRIFSSAFNF